MKPYNVWSSMLAALTIFIISCEERSTPTPTGGGNINNPISLNTFATQLEGSWFLDSTVTYVDSVRQSSVAFPVGNILSYTYTFTNDTSLNGPILPACHLGTFHGAISENGAVSSFDWHIVDRNCIGLTTTNGVDRYQLVFSNTSVLGSVFFESFPKYLLQLSSNQLVGYTDLYPQNICQDCYRVFHLRKL